MGKLSIARLFDDALVATTKAYEQLQPFIEHVNQFIDNVSRILTKNVTLADNLDAETRSVILKDGIAATLALTRRPLAVWIAKQEPTSPASATFVWRTTDKGELSVTATYATAPITPISVTLIILYA